MGTMHVRKRTSYESLTYFLVCICLDQLKIVSNLHASPFIPMLPFGTLLLGRMEDCFDQEVFKNTMLSGLSKAIKRKERYSNVPGTTQQT